MKKTICAIALMGTFTSSTMAMGFTEQSVNMVLEGAVSETTLLESPDVLTYRFVGDSWVVSINEENADRYFDHMVSMGYRVEKSVSFERELPRPQNTMHYNKSSTREFTGAYQDPELHNQTSLFSENNGLLAGMTSQRGDDAGVNVLVLDTGYLPHEDIEVLGGYSYTTKFGGSPNPNYTDETIDDMGTTCSSGHGTAMKGIIGATQNNGVGMTGISNANLYAGRVMATNCETGRDEGDLVDLYDALVDVYSSSDRGGIPKPDVINISLAAPSVCPDFLQGAINDVNDMGVTIVVSAGNANTTTNAYTPANCQNVIVVGAHDEDGRKAAYSNHGDQVDIGMAGEHLAPLDMYGYETQSGTSGAAAAVTGMVAVLKKNFPNSTPEELERVIKNSAKKYPDTGCQIGCGSGMANLEQAMRLAEKVLDPIFSVEHGMSGLERSCQVSALDHHMSVCQTALVDVKTSFAEGDDIVPYLFKVVRKDKSSDSWAHRSKEFVSEFEQQTNHEKIPLSELDFLRYDYGVASCSEDDCSFVTDIKEEDIRYPEYCL